MSNLVFGVGMPLTGNTTLAQWLTEAGYTVRDGAEWGAKAAIAFLSRGDKAALTDALRGGHNAWVGWPVVAATELAKRHPEARFILTVRDTASWIAAWKERAEQWRTAGDMTVLQSATNGFLFGKAFPTLGHAQGTYEQRNTAIQTTLGRLGVRLLVVNLTGRRAIRSLTRFAPALAVPDVNQG